MRVGYTPIHASVLILDVPSTYSDCSDENNHLTLRFARCSNTVKA